MKLAAIAWNEHKAKIAVWNYIKNTNKNQKNKNKQNTSQWCVLVIYEMKNK
jgi:hypothetical protein